jgi:hypothetical protein
MARYVRGHRGELDRERTFFVNVDSVSFGAVAYLTSEGAIVSYGMDRRLVELSAAVAEAGEAGAAAPIRIPFHSDALPARVRGFRAISVLGVKDGLPPPYYHTPADTPDKVDDEAMTRAVDFSLALVRALDRDLDRSLASAPSAAGQV